MRTNYPCPRCGESMDYVEGYREYWCNICKTYPYRTPYYAQQAGSYTQCPKCHGHLEFLSSYEKWWCRNCMSYPYDEPEKSLDREKNKEEKRNEASGSRKGVARLVKPTFKHDKFSTLDKFVIVDDRVYRSINGKPFGNPYYKIRGKRLYNTIFNPEGHDTSAWYEIRGRKIQPTIHHPKGRSISAWFEIEDKKD